MQRFWFLMTIINQPVTWCMMFIVFLFLIRLSEDGTILYSRRISIIAECPMDLTLFPFDSQLCKLGIESC